MEKFKLENGLTYYTVSYKELTRIGGAGICDHCGEHHTQGYLVPVLNHWICKACFEEWKKDARHFPEDDMYEENAIKYYESQIPLKE
jgi:hypothetical protein